MTRLQRALVALQTAAGGVVICIGLAVLMVGAWVFPASKEDER